MTNQHLMNAQDLTARAEAILFAVDGVFMEDADSRLQRLFYAVQDTVKQIETELDMLSGDCRVVDAIYAVNDAARQKGQE